MARAMLLMSTLLLEAQAAEVTPVAVEAALYDEATALPGHRVVGGPIHPGAEVGVGVPLLRDEPATRLDATVRFGAFHHAHLATALTLDAALVLERAFDFGGVAGASVGVGLLDSFAPRGELVPDGAGGYRAQVDRGRLAVRPHLAAELGWRLGPSAHAPRVLLRYRLWVEAPFSPGFIPLMVHGDTGVALRVPLAGRRTP